MVEVIHGCLRARRARRFHPLVPAAMAPQCIPESEFGTGERKFASQAAPRRSGFRVGPVQRGQQGLLESIAHLEGGALPPGESSVQDPTTRETLIVMPNPTTQSRVAWSCATAAIASIGFTISAAPAQSRITWSVADIVNAATDVSTNGTPCIAATLGPEKCEVVVNTVTFQADRGLVGSRVFTSGGYTLKVPYCKSAPGEGVRYPADLNYQAILYGARHGHVSVCRAITCSVGGLKPGRHYEIQILAGNSARPYRVSEWDNGQGLRGATNGGIFILATGPTRGQVATGTFVAGASGTQTFTTYSYPAQGARPEAVASISAVQLRDLKASATDGRAIQYGVGTPGTDRRKILGGTRCSPGINLEGGHPLMGATLTLTAENSLGAPTNCLIILGGADFTAAGKSRGIAFLGGYLLTDALMVVPAAMPFSGPSHDHELRLRFTLPKSRGTLHVQILQLDSKAPMGVSFTQGLTIQVGI